VEDEERNPEEIARRYESAWRATRERLRVMENSLRKCELREEARISELVNRVQYHEQELRVMESRLNVGAAELQKVRRHEQRQSEALETAEFTEEFLEFSAKQSAECEAVEVAVLRGQLRTQESDACQKLEMVQSRLNAEATAAHAMRDVMEASQSRLKELVSESRTRAKEPSDVSRLREELMEAQLKLSGHRAERTKADSVRKEWNWLMDASSPSSTTRWESSRI